MHALERQLHLNESVFAQYTHWLGGILTGNLGTSAATQEPVSQLLSGRIANSAFLVFVAAIIAIPLSIAFGSWMAVKRDTAVDYVGSTVSLVFAALPEFVIGIALVLLFATSVFHVFPAVSLIPPGDHAWDHPNVVILPAATLILAVIPYISRIMRGSMVEVLESDYVTMARLKGLPERTVICSPRGAERDRPGDPGLGAPARVDGGRHRPRRVRVLVPRHRLRARRRGGQP